MTVPAIALMGRSLVDDTSTVKSDADTTFATEDTYRLQHDTDMLLEQQSEHSGLPIDDGVGADLPNRRSFRTWNTKRDMSLADDDDSNGSTHQESPFLPRSETFMLKRQTPQTTSGETEEQQETLSGLQQHQHQQQPSHQEHKKEQEQQQQQSELLVEDGDIVAAARESWKHTDSGSGQPYTEHNESGQHNADYNGKIFACNMFLETKNLFGKAIMDHAKTEKASYILQNLFPKKKQPKKDMVATKPSDYCFDPLKLFKGAVTGFADRIDGVLIKFFNVCEIESSETNSRPKYALSVNQGLSNEYSHFLNGSVSNLKGSKLDDKVPTVAGSFLVRVTSDTTDSADDDNDASRNEKEVPDEEQRDIRDEREDVLAEKYAEYDSESVARILDKYIKKTSADKNININASVLQQDFGNDDDDKSTSDPTVLVTENKEKITQNRQYEEMVNENPVEHTRLSSLHKKHIVDLINKNLPSTNRSDFVDLTLLETMEEQAVSDLSTARLGRYSSAGRTSQDRPFSDHAMNPIFDSIVEEESEIFERSWHGNSFYREVKEVDTTLHQRKEKLRKMMADLSKTMNEAARGGDQVLEHRQDILCEDVALFPNTVVVVEHTPASLGVIDLTPASSGMIDLTYYDDIDPMTTEPIDLTLYEECY